MLEYQSGYCTIALKRMSYVALGLTSECNGEGDGDEFGLRSGLEKWYGDREATFRRACSKGLMYDIRPSIVLNRRYEFDWRGVCGNGDFLFLFFPDGDWRRDLED